MQEFIDNLIGRLEEEKYTREERFKYDRNTQKRMACVNKGLNKAIEIINELAEQHNNGWILCSERLPEESLNSVIGWDAYRQRCCFVQYYNGRWNLGNNDESVNIIAWQPVPVPPAYMEGEK